MFGRTAEQIEGQTRYLARAAGFLTRAARCGDRHDVRYTDQERSTCNAQLSTFNGVTERAYGGAGHGDRHAIWATGLLARWTCPSAGRAVQAGWAPRYGDRHAVRGPAEQIEGQARCPVCRSGTFNVKRSTLNFQRCGRKGACWAGYGDRHGVTATPITGFLPVCTVASLSAVSVFFPGGVSRGQGTKSKQIFPSPAALRFPINWRRYGVFGRQATLVPTAPGWGICVPRPQFTASQKGIEEF